MADGEAVIRLDADVSAYINKVVRAGKETKDVAKGMEESAAKWAAGNLKGLGALTAALVVVQAIATTAKTYSDTMQKASEAGGKQTVSEAQVLARMGKGRAAGQMLMNDEGANATRDQKIAFLGQVSNLQESRREKYLPQLKPQEVEQITKMFAQGGEAAWGAGGGDLVKGIQAMPAGVPVEQSLKRMIAGRIGMSQKTMQGKSLDDVNEQYMRTIPQEALDEVGAQAQEDQYQQNIQAGAVDSGRRARLLAQRKKQRDAENPWIEGVKDLGVGPITLRPLVEAGENISTGIATVSEQAFKGQTGEGSKPNEIIGVLKSIDGSLKKGKALPNLNTRSSEPVNP